ncbi:MAG: ferritin-like domain-containing protein [Myxococcales bacterium]
MRQRTLGERLRAIAFSLPFAGAMACGSPPVCSGSPCICSPCAPCPTVTELLSLRSPLDGGIPDGGCQAACEANGSGILTAQSCSLATLPDGGPGLSCTGTTPCHTGRRPPSLLASTRSAAGHPVGAHFAEAARLEAASVEAFELLASELSTHGAPPELVRAARRSAREEVRHARATARLALRYGAVPLPARLAARPAARSLETLAIENAREGCAGEAYGALLALWQASHAQDPAIARTLRSIAADEIRHAELAQLIAAWAEAELPRAARKRAREAKRESLASLRRESEIPVASPCLTLAGLPRPEIAAHLVDALASAV